MPRRIACLTLLALLFQALVIAPMAIGSCEGMQSSAAPEECAGHASHAHHSCPCCTAGGLACAGSCAAVALPVIAVAVTAHAPHCAVASITATLPSSESYTPPTPPPIA